MLPRLIKFLSAICVIISCAHADDLLSKLSGGKISEETKGVKKLSQDEMKKVWGGYYVYTQNVSDYHIGLLRISEALAIAVPDPKELQSKGLCDIGISSCYIPGSKEAYGHYTHYSRSENRYKELIEATNNNPYTQFLSFSLKRSISWINFRPTISYFTNATLVGIREGVIYKINSSLRMNSITREISDRYLRELKRGLPL